MKGMSIPTLGKPTSDSLGSSGACPAGGCRKKFGDRDEDKLTDRFHAELEDEFNRASTSGAVAKAFLSDLQREFRELDSHDLSSKIARRLIASVSFHPPEVERKTGGDLGIVSGATNCAERAIVAIRPSYRA